jgi:hypothetical protein
MDLLLDIFPAMRAPSPPAVPTPWERLKGNVRRAEGMLPVMHQLLARHRKTDYRALLTRCLERLVRQPLDQR